MTGTTPIDTIIQGDCLEEMKKLKAKPFVIGYMYIVETY